jgi:hypothetical protein
MEPYYPFILAALFGFILLAFLLLTPVYLFLDREEKASRHWTEEALARRLESKSGGGRADDHAKAENDNQPGL